jgi:ferredoxin--NADP+ reductase
VQPDPAAWIDFLPGQSTTLGLPAEEQVTSAGREASDSAGDGLIRREFSICSSPREKRYLEFLAVRIQTGQLTQRLWDLRLGDRLWMADKAKGDLTIENIAADRDLVMVATGTAIAPYMSILRTYRGGGRWRRFVIINGVRRAADLAYHEELQAAARTDPTVEYLPIVSREPDGAPWRGLRGHVQDVLEEEAYYGLVGAALDPARCHVFLCGNPSMIDSVQKMLELQGFCVPSAGEPGSLHLERYW